MAGLPDFLNSPIMRDQLQRQYTDPYKTGTESYLQGYQQAYAPQMIQQQAEMGRLENALKKAKEPYAGEEARLDNEVKKAQIAEALKQAKFGHLTGPAAEAYSLEQLRHNASPETVELAEKLIQSRQQNQESLIKSRQLLNDTSYKRASTALGKTAQELDEIENGFMPGSNYGVPINDERYQQKLANQYRLKLNKDTTDAQVRMKQLFATNIDKTLDSINVDALVKYSGPAGRAKLTAEQAKSLTGKASQDYINHEKAVDQAKTLAKQYRQTFGDSVSPQVLESINELTNPTGFFTSPEIAKEKLKSLRTLLKSETETFKNALQNTKEYEDEVFSEEQSLSQADLEFTAQKHGMTVDQVKELLSKGKR